MPLGGKCGVCGDAYMSDRPHESGGRYATNTIVRHYMSGALIDVKILVSEQTERICLLINSFVYCSPIVIRQSSGFHGTSSVSSCRCQSRSDARMFESECSVYRRCRQSVSSEDRRGYGTFSVSGHRHDLRRFAQTFVFSSARLPVGLSCSRCVLQWRYHAGNNWNRNTETGQACAGCALQEEFYK